MNTMSIAFQAKYRNLLDAAIKELGWTVNETSKDVLEVRTAKYGDPMIIDLKAERAEISRYQQDDLNKLKVQYARETLKFATRQKAWTYRPQLIQGQERGRETQGQIVRY